MQCCKEREKEIKFCGQESSTFPLGTEKDQEVRWGRLAEPSHAFLHFSGSGPSRPHDKQAAWAPPGAGFGGGGQIQSVYILGCPEINGTSK